MFFAQDAKSKVSNNVKKNFINGVCVLGYKLTGKGDVNEGQKQYAQKLTDDFMKSVRKFEQEVIVLGKMATKMRGDRTDEKIILKMYKKHMGPFIELIRSWNSTTQKNPHISEGKIQVQGIGMYDDKTLKKKILGMTKDLQKLAKNDEWSKSSENAIKALGRMWGAYQEWARNNESVNEGIFGKFDTGAGFKGNGMTVYDRNQEKSGDFKDIAHIAPNGKITIYDKNVKKEPKLMQSLNKISQEFKKTFKESVDEVKLNELKMSMEKFTDKLLNALEGDTADLSFGIKHNNKIEKMMDDVMDVDTYYQVKDKKEMTKGLKKVKSHVAKIKSLNKSIFDKVLSDIDTAHKTFEVNIQKRIKISESKKVNEGDVVESYDIWNEDGSFGYTMTGLIEAEYQGRKVKLGKPMQGDVKKFKVYVRDPKTKNVKKVNFGDPNMRIKKSNPARRRSFRARHNCANPGPRTKARYWSCRKW